MGRFFSDTFFKSFFQVNMYVYVEARSFYQYSLSYCIHVHILYNVLYMLSHPHPQFIKNISDNSFLTRPGSAITQGEGVGAGGGGGMMGDGD